MGQTKRRPKTVPILIEAYIVLSRARPELQLHVEPLRVRCTRAEPNPIPNAPYPLRPVYALGGHLNIENTGLALALRAAIIVFDGPGIFKHKWIKHIPGGHTFQEGTWLNSSTYALPGDDVTYPGHRFSMGGFSIETRSLKSQSIEMKYSLVAEGFSASRTSALSITPSELEGYAAALERADELMQSE